MLDHAATSAIAPAGSDLRVVADVRMVTPGRRVAALRVALRVTVTDEDEDIRSVERAVRQAVRTLVLVTLLLAALAAGATGPRGASPALAAAGGDLVAPAAEAGAGRVTEHADHTEQAEQADRTDRAGDPACVATACAAAPAVGMLPGATPAPAATAEGRSTVTPESDRLPRPALAARVVPSPD